MVLSRPQLPVLRAALWHEQQMAQRSGAEVVAHGNGNIATDIDLVIVEDHVRPSLATIDRKASIFSMTILNCAVPNKVGHRISSGRPKLCFSCLGWFEEHICVAIAIQLTSSFGSSCNIVPTIKIGLGDSSLPLQKSLQRKALGHS